MKENRPEIYDCCVSARTGWRSVIECLKSQVIFRKRATNHRALLRKVTYKDKASYGSSPPCITLYQSCIQKLYFYKSDVLYTT